MTEKLSSGSHAWCLTPPDAEIGGGWKNAGTPSFTDMPAVSNGSLPTAVVAPVTAGLRRRLATVASVTRPGTDQLSIFKQKERVNLSTG